MSKWMKEFIFPLILLSVQTGCNLAPMQPNPDDVATVVSKTMESLPTSTISPIQMPKELIETHQMIQTSLPPVMRQPDELRISLIGPDRNIYSWTKTGGMVMILEIGDAVAIRLSENGQFIAYTRENENQQYSLWVVEFEGSNPRQMLSWEDLFSIKTTSQSLGTEPVNLQWIPGTNLITFTTREVFEGLGYELNDDLIEVNAETGGWFMKLDPGAGGLVSYSPNGNWMAISTFESIRISESGGTPLMTGELAFEPVITYSEYRYYPSPVWSLDGGRLGVYIPPPDMLAEPRQPGSIWTMDVTGGDPILESELMPAFMDPVSISPDLMKVFYVKEVGVAAENKREIHTTDIDGKNERWVFKGGVPIVWNWNPNSEVFAYQSSNGSAVTISQLTGSVGDLSGTKNTSWFTWVDSRQFLFILDTATTQELYIGKWEGSENKLIGTLPKSEFYRMQVDFVR